MDGELRRVMLDEQPVEFPLGGSVTHFSVIGCSEGGFVLGGWSMSGPDETSWSGVITAFGLERDRLRPLRHERYEWSCPGGDCPTREQRATTGFDLECPQLPFN